MRNHLDIGEKTVDIKNKIIHIYEHILEKFGKAFLNFEARIQEIKRGVITPDGQEYYEDYFQCTHTELKEKLRKEHKNIKNPLIMVVKILTNKKEEVIFSTDVKDTFTPKKILYIDDILENTTQKNRHLFYDKISQLKAEEKIFWERKKLSNIKSRVQEELIENMC